MQKPSSHLQVQLGPLHDELRAFAKENGLTIAEAVRKAVFNLTTGTDVNPYRFSYGQTEGATKKCQIRLTASEQTAIRESARAMGLSDARWIHWLIRSHLTREPHFGQLELEALTSSNLALLKLSRALRSVAFSGSSSEIDRLSTDIAHHTFLVAELVRANLMRWGITR